MSDPGFLEVTVENQSSFLSNNLPFVVRDAHHAVVQRGTVGSARTALPQGLYSVAVVTPRGEEATRLVQINPGQTAPLVFADEELDDEPDQAVGAGPVHDVAPPPLDVDLPPTMGAAAGLGGGRPAVPRPAAPTAAELVSTDRCTVTSQGVKGWQFAPEPSLDTVPTAVFRIGRQRWEVSLPLNPAATEPELSTCRVEVVTVDGRPRLRVGFARRRRVSRMVDGLLRNNEAASSGQVLDVATELLLHKYSDPPGAVLGGLTLHRLGRLPEKKGWVENLARDFPWLPDGQVLCAALLLKDANDDERHRGLELLLAATRHRPLYTDGLSLATELLRRWPGTASERKRMGRLERLADYASYADWDSISLCVDISGEHR